MTETTFHAGATRRVKTADGHFDYSINVSGISIHASDDFIRMAVERAEYTLGVITDEIDRRIRGGVTVENHQRPIAPRVNHSAFESAPRPTDQRPPKQASIQAQDEEEVDPFADPNIPSADSVRMSSNAFGVEIPVPHFTWCAEPATRVNNDGEGGGQIKALNTALSAAGHKGVKRHPAALAILQAYGEIHGYEVRESIDSLNDLSKAEAHIILSFFELADSNALTALRIAMEVSCLK